MDQIDDKLGQNNGPVKTFRRKRDRSSQQQSNNPSPATNQALLDANNQLNTRESPHTNTSKPSSISKPPLKKKSLSQTHLDLGQKNFFSKRCPTCGLVYTPGKEEDERLHASLHKSPTTIKYSPSKTDVVVSTDGSTGSIICIQSTTSPSKLIRELALLLEEQLGLLPGWLLASPCTVFLYVCSSSRNILSFVFVEPIKKAWNAQDSSNNTMNNNNNTINTNTINTNTINTNTINTNTNTTSTLPTNNNTINTTTSTTTIKSIHSGRIITADTSHEVKARYGIRMMWTSTTSRRKGLATKLLDCVRSQITRGYVVSKKEIAFSQPTTDGAAFIQSYVESPVFLVYNSTKKM